MCGGTEPGVRQVKHLPSGKHPLTISQSKRRGAIVGRHSAVAERFPRLRPAGQRPTMQVGRPRAMIRQKSTHRNDRQHGVSRPAHIANIHIPSRQIPGSTSSFGGHHPMPASNDALLPRRRSIIDPQVRFDIMVRNQLLNLPTRFVSSDNSGNRHSSAEPGSDHRNGKGTVVASAEGSRWRRAKWRRRRLT